MAEVARGEGRRPIDAVAKGVFLALMRQGLALDEAAREAGFSLQGFYGARGRDSAFKADWEAAMGERALRARARNPWQADDDRDLVVAPNNRRRWQRRRMPHAEFTPKRRGDFLAHFAGSCDARAAADAIGVDHSTVYKHRTKDPDFAAAFQEALETGYVRLEAEALRQRLEAQARMRESEPPPGEIAQEFDRVMTLLDRWARRGGAVGPRVFGHGRLKRWSFDEAIAALDRKLRALGARREASTASAAVEAR